MLTHMVMFQLKDDCKDQAPELVRRLLALQETVEAIEAIEAGPNINPSARAYDVGLITRHRDGAALDAYREHPDHQAVLAFIGEIVADVKAVDFTD